MEDELTPEERVVQYVSQNNPEALQLLLDELRNDYTVDVDQYIRDENDIILDTQLTIAVKKGFVQVAEILIEYGADINVQIKGGNSALHLAVQNNDESMAIMLLQMGIDHQLLNDNKETAIVMAIRLHLHKMVISLLENGAIYDFKQKDENGMIPFHKTAFEGNIKLLETFLEIGQAPCQRDHKGNTILHYAAMNDKKEVFELLSKRGELNQNILNLENNEGNTPLFICVNSNNWDLVKLLIKYGANFEYLSSKDGKSILHRAVLEKNMDIIDKLITGNKFKVGLVDKENNTALHYAAINGDYEIAKYLLDKKADFTVVNNNGDTPLHCACFFGNYKIASLLLDIKKSDPNIVNNRKRTPLHESALQGQVGLIKLLLDKKAEIDMEDDEGHTALELAILSNQQEYATELIKFGAKVERPHKSDCETLLQFVIGKNFEMVAEAMIEAGASVDKKDKLGRFPIHNAVLQNSLRIVKALTQHNCDINVQEDVELCTPLMLACKQKNVEITDWLLQCNACLSIVDINKWTCLHHACKETEEKIVSLLLEKDVDVNASDKDGKSPLHVAVEMDNYKIAELLIDKNANIEQKDFKGRTPLHIAVER